MTCNSCACGSNPNYAYIPARGPWAALKAVGVTATCQSETSDEIGTIIKAVVPPGWSVVATELSPFHRHLVDAEGKPVACLLSKPASGGAGSFQMTEPGNCAASK